MPSQRFAYQGKTRRVLAMVGACAIGAVTWFAMAAPATAAPSAAASSKNIPWSYVHLDDQFTNQCLDASGGAGAGAPVVTYQCHKGNAGDEQWTVELNGRCGWNPSPSCTARDGQLVNRVHDECLSAGSYPYTHLVLAKCANASTEDWNYYLYEFSTRDFADLPGPNGPGEPDPEPGPYEPPDGSPLAIVLANTTLHVFATASDALWNQNDDPVLVDVNHPGSTKYGAWTQSQDESVLYEQAGPIPPGGFENAFSGAGTTDLWTSGTAGTQDQGSTVAPGTSPAVATVAGGDEIAYQTDDGDLAVAGTDGTEDTGLGMMPGTSPSIHGLLSGGYEVAFQANTGDLWVMGTSWTGDTGQGMAVGTSPSITATNSSYEVAFQANTGYLYTWNDLAGPSDLGLGMMPRTSPSITGLWMGGTEIAFQANTGDMWVTGNAGTRGPPREPWRL
jgi:Ricin-type beta-trefoil lectin domain